MGESGFTLCTKILEIKRHLGTVDLVKPTFCFLKVESATFLQVCFWRLKKITFDTRTNVVYVVV